MLLTLHSSISMREFSVTPGQFSVTFFPASTTISPTMESGNRDIVRPSRRGRYRENKKQRKLTLSVNCEDLHDRAASGPFRQRSDKTSFLSTLSTLDDCYGRDQSSRVVSKFQHFATFRSSAGILMRHGYVNEVKHGQWVYAAQSNITSHFLV